MASRDEPVNKGRNPCTRRTVFYRSIWHFDSRCSGIWPFYMSSDIPPNRLAYDISASVNHWGFILDIFSTTPSEISVEADQAVTSRLSTHNSTAAGARAGAREVTPRNPKPFRTSGFWLFIFKKILKAVINGSLKISNVFLKMLRNL